MNIKRGLFGKETEWVNRIHDFLCALPAKEVKSPLLIQVLPILFVRKHHSANLEALSFVV